MFESFLCTCLEADWPSEERLGDHTRAGTLLSWLCTQLPLDGCGSTRNRLVFCTLRFFTLKSLGSLSKAHLDNSKIFQSSFSKDYSSHMNSLHRAGFKEMSVTLENITRCSFWSPPLRKMLQTTNIHERTMKDIQCWGLGHKTFVRIWIMVHYVLMAYFIFVLKENHTSKKGNSVSKWGPT